MTVDNTLGTIVLAAGRSSRFAGGSKLLAHVNGTPVLRRVLDALVSARLPGIHVITGAFHAEIETLLADYDISLIHNPGWQQGMGSSLALGIQALRDLGFDGAFVCLGDLPYLTEDSVRTIHDAFHKYQRQKIIIPEHQGRPGHPIAFPARFFKPLSTLSGDSGAKHLIQQNPDSVHTISVDHPGIHRDIDTNDDIP